MLKSLSQHTKLIVFFVCTYAWSWLFWFPAVRHLSQDVLEAPPWALAMLLIGAYGPSLMALAVTGLTEGASGVKRLLGKFLIWRVGLRWYAVVLLLPSLVTLGAVAILVARGGDIGSFSLQRAHVIPLALLAAAPFGPLAEELGWRGFALPRLLEQRGVLTSSLVIGAAWTFWHTPLFWAPAGTSLSGEPVTWVALGSYLALLSGLSVVFTWVHVHTGGSVWMAFLLHLTFNADVIFFLLPNRPDDADSTIWKLSVLPLWALIAVGAYVSWRRKGDRLPESVDR